MLPAKAGAEIVGLTARFGEKHTLSVKKSLAWMTLAQLGALVVQFAATVVLARYLTPKEVGVAAVAVAITGIISIFQQLGLPSLIVREKVLTEDVALTAFTINAVVTLLLSLAIVVISFAGAAFVHDARVQQVLLVLAISPLFGIAAFLPASNIEREGRFKALALIGTASAAVSASVTIALATTGYSYMSVAYAQISSSGFSALVLTLFGREHAQYRPSFRAWRRVTSFSFQMLAITGINTASQRLSEIVMGRFLGLGALGLFNRANGINGLIWNNIHLAVGRIALVEFSELKRQGISLRSRYLRTVALVTATLWPAFAGLGVIAQPFIEHVYGTGWLPAVVPFKLIAISSIILSCSTMAWELFTANDELATQTRIESAKAVGSFIVFVLACLISLEAAATVRIVDAVIAFFVYRPHINRMTDTVTADYWPIYAQSLLLTGLSIAPAGVVIITSNAHGLSLGVLGASIALGVALWAVTLFLLKHPLAAEIEHTLRSRLG